MKTTFMLIAITLNFSFICFSREKNIDNDKKKLDSLIIRYDARTGIASKYPPYEVDQNGYIRFEVNNINLFRYSVTLTELQNNVINSSKLSEGNTQVSIDPMIFNLTDVNLNIQIIPVAPNDFTKALSAIGEEKSEMMKKIERKEKEIQKEEAQYSVAKKRIDRVNEIDLQLETNKSNLNYLTSIGEDNLSKEQKAEKADLEKQKRNLDLEKSSIDLINKIVDDKAYIKTYEETKKDVLEKELYALRDSLAEIEQRYNKKVLDDKTSHSIFESFNSALGVYKESLNKLNAITDMYQRLVSVLYSDQPVENIKNEKNRIVKDFIKEGEITGDNILKEAYQRLRDVDVKYYALSEVYSKVSAIDDEEIISSDSEDESTDISEIKDKSKEIFDKISAFHGQIKTTTFHTFFMQLIKVYDAINESNFTLTYQTLILTDNADLINYNLKAEPHTNLPYSLETRPINFNYDVKIKGGVKIDVSTGVFWNIGLDDNSYRFESVTAESSRVIKEDNENLFIPSFGVLFNIYRRSNKNVKLGGNLGISTNTEKLNYYLGGSVLIGKSERLNINLGFAGAQVKTVSDLYNTEEVIPVPIKDLPNEVPLRNPSPFKIGFYFGVSFNLLGTKNNETLSKISTL